MNWGFWEIHLAAHLNAAQFKVTLGKPNPDILAQLGKRKYFIQCKRLYSTSSLTLEKNIRKAVEQLEVDLQSDTSPDALGVIALSLERRLTHGKLMLITDSESTGKETLMEFLKGVISEHGYLWQNPNLIKNPRIVGIILHVLVPAIVKDRNNMFVTGSQIAINNTWPPQSGNGGFQLVIEDFWRLKKDIERTAP